MVPDLDTARSVPTLVAGDQFVLNRLLLDALRAEVGDRLATAEMELNWPTEPFGPVAEVHEAAGTEELMLAAVPGIEIAVTEMAPFTARVIEAAHALRLIVVCRGGPVNVNLGAATARGIPVCYTPARNAAATAEYTVGLLLAAMRRLAEGHKDLIGGVWRGDFYAYREAGTELEGKTAGLVGFGAVGRRVASVLRALGRMCSLPIRTSIQSKSRPSAPRPSTSPTCRGPRCSACTPGSPLNAPPDRP